VARINKTFIDSVCNNTVRELRTVNGWHPKKSWLQRKNFSFVFERGLVLTSARKLAVLSHIFRGFFQSFQVQIPRHTLY